VPFASDGFIYTVLPNDVLSCPYGGNLSNGICVNATPCTAPQIRNATTGACETPPPVTCQTTPTTTTSGSTQTLSWETLNTGSNTCDPHSLNCDYPLAVNATTKQCDLSCPDGSTVDVSAGAQCPPPSCPNTVHGNMIIKQTYNTVTLKCENSDIVYCDGQRETPDVATGTCLPKPNLVDCGNGVVVISPVKCSSEPDHSQDITCPDGTIISPPRVCAPLPPDPAKCPGGASAVETTGYVLGVPTCIMKDGTTTAAAADGSQSPPDDKYNPQGYKAGVACNASNSYPCDPSLPVVSTPGLTGIEKCGPGTFFVCADKHDKPVVPDLHPKAPATTTATTTTGTGTTTIINSDGSTSTQTTTTNNTGTTTTTGGSTAGLATEDTAREIASRLGGTAKGTGAATGAGMGTFTARGKNTNPNLGKWYEATTDTYGGVFQTNANSVKDSPLMGFSQKIFNVSIPGGECPVWTIPAVMNMQAIPVSPLCSDFMDSIFPIISALVQASAVFMVFRIIISGFKS